MTALLVWLSFLIPLFLPPTSVQAQVLTGIDVLEQEGFKSLQGKRIGLITNQTGRDRKGRSTVEILLHAPGVNLRTIFSPEHGLEGNLEQEKIVHSNYGASRPATCPVVLDGTTQAASIPIYSLYGETNRPTPQMLKDLDALVFDIQDAGARFYTYGTTMGYAMEEAAKAGLEFFVLDRPNPIGGIGVEGAVLPEKLRSFIGYYCVPTRHGMTLGEIANLYNQTAALRLKLIVVRMKGWKRSQWYDRTGLPWVAPSPNMPDLNSAILYPGTGAFEAVNVSVGRGTSWPFRWIGAPWMDSVRLAQRMSRFRLPGLRFYPAQAVPSKEPYSGVFCRGVLIRVTDRNRAEPTALFAYLLSELQSLHGDRVRVQWDRMAQLAGVPDMKEKYEKKKKPEALARIFRKESEKFKEQRRPFLLYP